MAENHETLGVELLGYISIPINKLELINVKNGEIIKFLTNLDIYPIKKGMPVINEAGKQITSNVTRVFQCNYGGTPIANKFFIFCGREKYYLSFTIE